MLPVASSYGTHIYIYIFLNLSQVLYAGHPLMSIFLETVYFLSKIRSRLILSNISSYHYSLRHVHIIELITTLTLCVILLRLSRNPMGYNNEIENLVPKTHSSCIHVEIQMSIVLTTHNKYILTVQRKENSEYVDFCLNTGHSLKLLETVSRNTY